VFGLELSRHMLTDFELPAVLPRSKMQYAKGGGKEVASDFLTAPTSIYFEPILMC
jgi:hypothetical protein